MHKLVATLSSESGSKHARNITSMFLAINDYTILPADIVAITSLLKILASTLTRLLMDQRTSYLFLLIEECFATLALE